MKQLNKLREKLLDFRFWLTKKLWLGDNPDQTLSKRFKLFIVIGITLIASSKLLHLAGLPIPNIELIIPTLVVVGAFSFYTGASRKWEKTRKYFGIIALISVFIIDITFWGFRKIYLFTWPGFLICWYLGIRKDFDFYEKFSDLAVEATITAAIAIILFDVFTAVGFWMLWRPITLGALYAVFIAQIPFTLYHLGSLIFVPPLVGFGKMAQRVKVRAPVAAKAATRERQRR